MSGIRRSWGQPVPGKSTLLALIAAQFRRYSGAQIFIFDKGSSILPLTLAVGGKHYGIGEEDSDLAFCPLQDIDTAYGQSLGAGMA
jgi:type IV secretion system protein VirB4